jgi:hypothetical protein
MGRNFGRLTAKFGLALPAWTASSDGSGLANVLFSYFKYEARSCMYGKLWRFTA